MRTVLLAVLLMLLSACATLDPDFDEPTVEVVGLRPLANDGMEARFEVSLRVINPNAEALYITGLYYEVEVEDTRLLSGASDNDYSVPGYGAAVLKVPASASMFGSFNLLRQLMSSPPKEGIGYSLNAKISVQGWPVAVRVEREGRIGGPVQKT